ILAYPTYAAPRNPQYVPRPFGGVALDVSSPQRAYLLDIPCSLVGDLITLPAVATAQFRARNQSGASPLHAMEALHEGMTEAEVAAALEISHLDEGYFRFTGSVASVRYICRGRRFPGEYIDCHFDWWSRGTTDESGKSIRIGKDSLTLKNWSRVRDWRTLI